MNKSEIHFKNILIKHFKSLRRPTWSKDEIVEAIKDLWIDWLEDSIINKKKGGKK